MNEALVPSPNEKLTEFEVFPWHESFDTGHPLVDQEHKKLVKLLNKLANSLADDDEFESNHAFNELADYANVHFADEEKLWAKYFGDDQWFLSHKNAHTSFLPKVLELKDSQPNAPLSQVIEDIVKFLIRWLAFHIVDTDKRMALAIAAIEQGQTLSEAKEFAAGKMSGAMRDLIEAILSMYEGLSSNALRLIKERNARLKVENRLREAYKELEAVSVTDQLTGLYNRRYMDEIVSREFARAIREKKPFAVYLIDIDHFKNYNDLYGHIPGDEALKRVALTIQASCQRAGDFTFRYGGEEFCVLATNTNQTDAAVLGEKIRNNVESLQIQHDDSQNSEVITVSVGGVVCMPNFGDDFLDTLNLADDALYESKANGRNRITLSPERVNS